MTKHSASRTIVLFLFLIVLVIGLSLISNMLWRSKPEKLPEPAELVIGKEMTVGEFGRVNNLPNPLLKGIFDLQVRSDLQKKLSHYGTPDQVRSLVIKKMALAAEHATKNWIKIAIVMPGDVSISF